MVIMAALPFICPSDKLYLLYTDLNTTNNVPKSVKHVVPDTKIKVICILKASESTSVSWMVLAGGGGCFIGCWSSIKQNRHWDALSATH